jgi:hypothetical protein
MKNMRNFVFKNLVSVSLICFLILFFLIIYIRPNAIYNKDGTLREFGIGYREKTVFPMWLVTVILAITAYFITLYSVTAHRFVY